VRITFSITHALKIFSKPRPFPSGDRDTAGRSLPPRPGPAPPNSPPAALPVRRGGDPPGPWLASSLVGVVINPWFGWFAVAFSVRLPFGARGGSWLVGAVGLRRFSTGGAGVRVRFALRGLWGSDWTEQVWNPHPRVESSALVLGFCVGWVRRDFQRRSDSIVPLSCGFCLVLRNVQFFWVGRLTFGSALPLLLREKKGETICISTNISVVQQCCSSWRRRW